MKANTHDLLIGHIFSVYLAEGGHSRAGSPEEGGVCVISPVTRDRMTFGLHFKSTSFLKVHAKLKRLTVSVPLNDEHSDEDQLTHSSGLVTV